MRIAGFAAEDDEFSFGCTVDEKSAIHPSGYAQKTIGPGSLRGKGGGLACYYPTESGQHNVSEPIQLSGRARRTRREETQDKTKERQCSREGPVNLSVWSQMENI